MLLRNILFFTLISFLFSSQSFALEKKDDDRVWKSSPIFSNEEDNIRNKSLLFGGFGFAFNVNGANHTHNSSADATHTLNWGNMFNVGIVADLGLNITDRLWVNISTENTWGVGGNATLMNVTSISAGNFVSAQYNNAKNNQYEVKAIIGYDIARFSKLDVSLYGGFMYKALTYNTGIGTLGAVAGSTATTGDAGPIMHNFNIMTAVVGVQEKYYDAKTIYTAFQEFYVGGIASTNFNNSSVSSSYYKDWGMTNMPTLGFAVGGSAEFAVGGGVYLKPFVKYQMIFMPNLSELKDTGIGYFNIWSATGGIGLSWN